MDRSTLTALTLILLAMLVFSPFGVLSFLMLVVLLTGTVSLVGGTLLARNSQAPEKSSQTD